MPMPTPAIPAPPVPLNPPKLIGYTTHCLSCGKTGAIYYGEHNTMICDCCGGQMIDDDPICG